MRQLLIHRFGPDARLEGQLAGALERMESGGTLRILEALYLARDAETGELAALDLHSHGAGSLVSPLLEFRLDPGARARATAEALAAAGGDRLRAVGDALAPGSAITAVLVEHTWAQVLDDAVSRSGGGAAWSGVVETESLADAVELLVAAAR